MADPAAKSTDDILEEIERRIGVEYRQAARELSAKVEDYWKRYRIKDRKWHEWVAEEKKTRDKYKEWLTGQLAAGDRWEKMRDTIAEDLVNVNAIAKSIASGYMPEVYAENHAWGTYEVETGARVDTGYTIYSREAIEYLFRENPQILPDPGRKVSKDIAEGKAKRWERRHIQSVMAQAILQGNSIPDIATRLANAVCDSDRRAAIRNARTMATGTQNKARVDAYRRAEDLGIETKKTWIATLDMRTRHEHRLLDGEQAGLDDPFVVEGEKIMYPGDPSAAPHLVYGCRCTLLGKVKGWDYGRSMARRSLARLEKEGLTYEQWKENRVEKTNPWTLPEEKQDAIRAQYIREYRGYGGAVKSGRDMTLDIDSKGFMFVNSAPSSAQPDTKAWRSQAGGAPLQDTMSRTAYTEYTRKMKKAPDAIRNATEKYNADIRYVNIDIQRSSDHSFYSPGENTVHYSMSHQGDQGRFDALFHEDAHALDDSIDGKLAKFGHDELDVMKKIFGNVWRVLPSNSDRFLDAMREDIDVIKYSVSYDTWPTINRDLMDHDSTDGVQDFLDGIFEARDESGMGKRVKLIWTHGDKYYDRVWNWASEKFYDLEARINVMKRGTDYEDMDPADFRRMCRDYETASELWANISSALCEGGTAEKYMRMFAPNSINAFMEILDEATK